ncbi:NAD(P)/FAD-dependent oxidoreductase [Shimazuella kribbensis]|uniref:NAD(P)/FAD-dependent oxidoreductase n=1 Tax=Shimazuella kribbensis TaxID=139808 RepID=UPI00040806ED|nr:FAD/NAD(P)-binding oxidoreductase [Shimazuella kribbensis]
MMEKQYTDVLIIGAGPAGLAAATNLFESGFKITILDEFPHPGGRLLGQFHEESDGSWWIGRQVASELVEMTKQPNISLQCGVSVYGLKQISEGWEVLSSVGTIETKYLLLATGAAEIPVPLEGWTLPGVMSIGAAQVLTNVHMVKPGDRGIIVGVNVLGLAISRELAVAGVDLAGIVLSPNNLFSGENANPVEAINLLMSLSHLAPSAWMRLGGSLAQKMKMGKWVSTFFPRQGMNVWDIPLLLKTTISSIQGKKSVESVVLADVNSSGQIIAGSEREEKVDFVALAGGLYPLAELAAVAGCSFLYLPELGGNIPLHNEQMKTPLSNLYVAGNITGVEGAQVAMAQGKLAARSIGNDAGLLKNGREKIAEAMDEVHQVRKTATIQFHPGIIAARKRVYEMYDSLQKESLTS